MPTSGTHVTVVHRLATDAKYKALLGDPSAALQRDHPDHPDAIKMRCACLGAVGPDIFYALADYGGSIQDLENIVVKVLGTFTCIGELMGKINRYVSGELSNLTLGISKSLSETFTLLTAIVKEDFEALLVREVYNFWAFFEPPRQKDLPREEWYWADYLHYARTGRFTKTLLDNASNWPTQNKQFLQAYSLGYLTHYVTDVVGHPYVNQVVQSPWRMYWQRHHLVENFIDAYVWDAWHTPNPEPKPPSTEEQALDNVVAGATPNAMGSGAPYTFARLNDWINIGTTAFDDLEPKVEAICKKIEKGLFDLGVVEDLEPAHQPDTLVKEWAQMMAASIQSVYPGVYAGGATPAPDERHPTNLAHGVLLKNGSLGKRPNAWPLAEHVISAYTVFRFIIKMTTEDKIKKPQPPNVLQDIGAAVNRLLADLAHDLHEIQPPPLPGDSGSFSLSSLLDWLEATADWVVKTAEALGKAAFDLIKNSLLGVLVLPADAIRYLLYLVNTALYGTYRSFRDILVLLAYAAPFTDQLDLRMGGFDATTLWQSNGNPDTYPREETTAERSSSYNPAAAPTTNAERVPVHFVGPYARTVAADGSVTLARPDDFLDRQPVHEMFAESSSTAGPVPQDKTNFTFRDLARDFGGSMDNSRIAIDRAVAGGLILPDYNLDGDRGYAWPAWDVVDPVEMRPANGGDPKFNDPLNPDHQKTSANGIATVKAAPLT